MRRLTDVYADDLALFASLSGVDVSDWPTTRIAAGTLDPADLAQSWPARSACSPRTDRSLSWPATGHSERRAEASRRTISVSRSGEVAMLRRTCPARPGW